MRSTSHPTTEREHRLLWKVPTTEVVPSALTSIGSELVESIRSKTDDAAKTLPRVLKALNSLKADEQSSVLERAKKELSTLPESVQKAVTENLASLERRIATVVTAEELTTMRSLLPSVAGGRDDASSHDSLWEKTRAWMTDASERTMAWTKSHPVEAAGIAATASIGLYGLYRLGRWLFGKKAEGASVASAPRIPWYVWVPGIGIATWGIVSATKWIGKNTAWMKKVTGWMGKGSELAKKGKDAVDPYIDTAKGVAESAVQKGRYVAAATKKHGEELVESAEDLALGEGRKYGLSEDQYHLAEEAYREYADQRNTTAKDDTKIRQIFGLKTREESQAFTAFIKDMDAKHRVDIDPDTRVHYVRGDKALENYRAEITIFFEDIYDKIRENKDLIGILAITAVGTQLTSFQRIVGALRLSAKTFSATVHKALSILREIFAAVQNVGGIAKEHPILAFLGAATTGVATLEAYQGLRKIQLPENWGELMKASGVGAIVKGTKDNIAETLQKTVDAIKDTGVNIKEGAKKVAEDTFAYLQKTIAETANEWAQDAEIQALRNNSASIDTLRRELARRYTVSTTDVNSPYALASIRTALESLNTWEEAYIRYCFSKENAEHAIDPSTLYAQLVQDAKKAGITIDVRGEYIVWKAREPASNTDAEGADAHDGSDDREMRLCVRPVAQNNFLDHSSFIERSVTMQVGNEGMAAWVGRQLAQSLKREWGQLNGTNWGWMANGLYYIVSETGDVLMMPIDVVEKWKNEDKEGWRGFAAGATHYVIAGVEVAAFSITTSVALRISRLAPLIGGGGSVKKILGYPTKMSGGQKAIQFMKGILSEGEPFTAVPRLASKVIEEVNNRRVWRYLINEERNVRSVAGATAAEIARVEKAIVSNANNIADCLQKEKIRPQWFATAAEGTDLKEMQYIAHELGITDIAETDPAAFGKKLYGAMRTRMKTALEHMKSTLAEEKELDIILERITDWAKKVSRWTSAEHNPLLRHASASRLMRQGMAKTSELYYMCKRLSLDYLETDGLLAVKNATRKSWLYSRRMLRKARVAWRGRTSGTPISTRLMGAGGMALSGLELYSAYSDYSDMVEQQERAQSSDMRELYRNRQWLIGTNATIGTIGVITSGASVLGVGGTVGAALTTTGVIMGEIAIPLAVVLGSTKAWMDWNETRAMGGKEIQAQESMTDTIAKLQTKPEMEWLGQMLPFLLRTGSHGLVNPGARGMSTALATSESAPGKVSREERVDQKMLTLARFTRIALDTTQIQMPTAVIDQQTKQERTPTKEEQEFFREAAQAYFQGMLTHLKQSADGTAMEPLAATRNINRYLRDARYAAQIAHDRFVAANQPASLGPKDPDAIRRQNAPITRKEIEALRTEDMESAIIRIAQAMDQQALQETDVQTIVASLMEQELAQSHTGLEAALQNANFIDWWPDSFWPDDWLKSANRADIVREHLLRTTKESVTASASTIASRLRAFHPRDEAEGEKELAMIAGQLRRAVDRAEDVMSMDPSEVWHALSREHLQVAEKEIKNEQRLATIAKELSPLLASTPMGKGHAEYHSPANIAKRMRIAALRAEEQELGATAQHDALRTTNLTKLIAGKRMIHDQERNLRATGAIVRWMPSSSTLRIAAPSMRNRDGGPSLVVFFNPDTGAWEWLADATTGATGGLPSSLLMRKQDTRAIGSTTPEIPMMLTDVLSREQQDAVRALLTQLASESDAPNARAA